MATANDFPLDPVDGALAELEKQDGSIVVYRYDEQMEPGKLLALTVVLQNMLPPLMFKLPLMNQLNQQVLQV